MKHLVKLLNGGKLKKLELVVSEEILNSITENEVFKKELVNNENTEIICMEKTFKFFLTCGDEFMSLTLFFKDGHYDDSQILIAEDENAIKWSRTLTRTATNRR